MQEDRFASAASVLSENMIQRLAGVPKSVRERATEIRLRTGLPLMIITTDEPLFVLKSGEVSYQNRSGCYIVTDDDVQKSFRKLCGYSVHSYQNEIKNGFLTVGGNRVGFCGTAVTEEGRITAVRKITSLNVRIARQVRGVADAVVKLFSEKDRGGVLIVGAPSSGKTTLLKDLVRQLADGSVGRYWRVAVVDERSEIGGERGTEEENDIGCSVDLFCGYPKSKGMEIAIRTMSPEILVCDEIGNRADLDAVREATNSGVTVVATLHARDRGELLKKPFLASLLDTGAFSHFVFLDSRKKKCKISEIRSVDQLTEPITEEKEQANVEALRDTDDHNGFVIHRGFSVVEFIKEGE